MMVVMMIMMMYFVALLQERVCGVILSHGDVWLMNLLMNLLMTDSGSIYVTV